MRRGVRGSRCRVVSRLFLGPGFAKPRASLRVNIEKSNRFDIACVAATNFLDSTELVLNKVAAVCHFETKTAVQVALHTGGVERPS